MVDESMTLQSLLEDERIREVAPYAIKALDLSREPLWTKTLAQLRREQWGGNVERGMNRLFRAAEEGTYCHRIWSETDIAADPDKAGVNLVWLPSDDPGADDRPYLLILPGGGFVNVWNLTEGWPIADHFNAKGYHAFVLTYRVGGDRTIPHEMEDVAAALRYIRDHQAQFRGRWDRYITCGFSAGGYLVCLWSTKELGYGAFDLPKPRAMFPVYPFVSWRVAGEFAPETTGLAGLHLEETLRSAYEIPEHVEGFPPCALFLAAEDTTVPPEHSRVLKRALDAQGIPCRLEICPKGGHGFADGSFMGMKGWPERAIDWYEDLVKNENLGKAEATV